MIFFSFTVAALMMSMVILQYSHVYLTTEHTQMLADVIADGITVGADSGWGLIYSTSSKGYKDSAVKVKEKLISANTDRTGSGVSYLIEEDYDDKVSLKSSKKTGEKGIRQAYYTIQGKKMWFVLITVCAVLFLVLSVRDELSFVLVEKQNKV